MIDENKMENNEVSENKEKIGEVAEEVNALNEANDTVTVTEDTETSQEENKIDAESETEEKETEEKATYAFRWTYTDQYVHDKGCGDEVSFGKKPKKKKTGVGKNIGIYVIVMLVAFSFAFSVLAISLSFDDMARWFADDPTVQLSVSDIVDKGMPSSIAVYSKRSNGSYSAGSGFVINEYGYAVTNYHVIENSTSIAVVDSENRQYSASVVGYDAADDVAVLFIDDCKLAPVTLGDSDALKLGETLVAIGTPSGEECAFSATNGIVSGLNRHVSGKNIGMIQTNAELNPGNSGGPLFNSKGELVGIVTLKYAYTGTKEDNNTIPYEGMSFALPINGVIGKVEAYIREDLVSPKVGIAGVPVEAGVKYFYSAPEGRRYECVEINGEDHYVGNDGNIKITEEKLADGKSFIVEADKTGILVVNVTPGLGGDGKLERGDIIVSGNGIEVKTVQEFIEICNSARVGESINVVFYRNGERKDVDIFLMTKEEMLKAQN